MTRAKLESLLKPKQIAVSVAACFALNAAQLQANPTGPTVVHGGVGISGLGTSALTITNQAGGNAVINWNGFSIGVNELTRFQQFANLAVLNRVTGNELSSILGALQSDGRVFLINPNGIVFGASARIDTAGLVASSLGLSDQDFLANRLRFTEVPGAGAVVNNGVIQTAAGGRVYLVAPTVENNGLIQSPQGAIVLAAGREIELVDANAPYLTVKVAAAADSALNVGNLIADSGRIGMFGSLVRNAGRVEASGAIVGPGGEIRLVASKDLTLDAGSLVAANGTSGGSVLLQAEGGTNIVAGTVEAKGSAGAGGEVNALGVRVGVVGHGVIDASGDTRGGTVLVGGDYQGGNAAVQNAERTYIGTDGVIRADAGTSGDGGRVIVWADGDTRFFGSISARGGSQAGNGGFVETSGKEALQAFGSVDVGAANGTGGSWLLDPTSVSIVAVPGANDPDLASYGGFLAFDTPPGASEISSGAITAAMYGGSVTIQATADVTFNASVDTSVNLGSLQVAAYGNINLGPYSITTAGSVALAADADLNGTGSITSSAGGGNITTNGGNVNLSGLSVTVGNINTSTSSSSVRVGGSVYISASNGGITVNGAIDTHGANGTSGFVNGGDGGDVYFSASYGAVTVTGAIDTSGGSGVAGETTAYGAVGGSGGSGGYVDMYGSSITIVGPVTTRGGNGGNGGAFSLTGSTLSGSYDSRGGDGGYGGNVYFNSAGAIAVNGKIDTSAGHGVAGGSVSVDAGGSSISVDASADGGDGGYAGSVYLYGSTITAQDISAVAGNGGVGGSATVSLTGGDASSVTGYASARGGSGGSGSHVYLYAPGGVSVGKVDTATGSGAAGGTASTTINSDFGTASAYAYAYGGSGGDGGEGGYVSLNAPSGSVSAGDVTATGGGGGSGGFASASTNGPVDSATAGSDARGGSGGSVGHIELYGPGGAVTAGTLDARGASNGNGGTAQASVNGALIYANADANASGGYSGYSSYSPEIIITGTSINVGQIVGSTGHGGNGGTASAMIDAPTTTQAYAYVDASGGGSNSGAMVQLIAPAGNVSAGAIDVRGGTGGSGGSATATVQNANGTVYAAADSVGGGGYYGGSVSALSGGSLSLGTILGSGGNGGTGGTASALISGGAPTTMSAYADASGGSGAYGGAVDLVSASTILSGLIDVHGGAGAAAGDAFGANSSGSHGGDGGYGGGVYIYGAGEVEINTGGSLGAVAINSTGGAGGAGDEAHSPAGGGGAGGIGGNVAIYGTPNMTLLGSVNASGGAGGVGGTGNATNQGGIGGAGGNAGTIYLDASSTTASQIGDGFIFVLAGTQFNVQGGAGGAGGADLGAGAGAAGSAGGTNTFISRSDYFGNFVIPAPPAIPEVIFDPLSIPAVNSAYQPTVDGSGDTTIFVGGEYDREEDEGGSNKEFASCKG